MKENFENPKEQFSVLSQELYEINQKLQVAFWITKYNQDVESIKKIDSEQNLKYFFGTVFNRKRDLEALWNRSEYDYSVRLTEEQRESLKTVLELYSIPQFL